MCARTDLREAWVGNHPGPPGPTQVSAGCQLRAVCRSDARRNRVYVVDGAVIERRDHHLGRV